MAEFKTNDDMFGRYVRIQTDYSKALHIYKVVSRFESNTYCDIPILVSSKAVKHEQVVPVLNVIHCGIDESKVIRVALDDCEIVPTKSIEPEPDVAPVRHGKWKIVDNAYGEYECSVCGARDSDCSDAYGVHIVLEQKYCPNCGAKMILEDEP